MSRSRHSLSVLRDVVPLAALAALSCTPYRPPAVPSLQVAERPGPSVPGPHHVFVSGQSEIAVYELSPLGDKLTARGRFPGGNRPSYLAFGEGRRHVYANQNLSPGGILAFAFDAGSGALRRLNEVPTAQGGIVSWVSHLAMHPSGRWLLTAHLASGHVTVHGLGRDGHVQPMSDLRVLAKGAHQVVIDRSGKHVLVPCRDSNVIAQLRFDAQTGTLAPNDPPAAHAPLPRSGPRHLALHPSERFAYVINEANGTMTSYRYDAGRGLLSDPAWISTVPAGVEETGTSHVLVHPSGKFVYGANRFHNSLVIYAVDPDSGRLSLIGFETAGGAINFPRDFDIDGLGRLLAVVNEKADTLILFSIDGLGKLTALGPPIPTVQSPLYVGIVRGTL